MFSKSWIDAFNPNIPSSFTEALSYLEQLRKNYSLMEAALNELESSYSNLNKMVEDKGNEIKSEIYENLNKEVDGIYRSMQEQNKEWDEELIESEINIYARISDLWNDLDNAKRGIGKKFDNLIGRINEIDFKFARELIGLNSDYISLSNRFEKILIDFSEFKLHVDEQMQKELEKIKEDLTNQAERINGDIIIVSSPLSGESTTLKKALQEIADWKQPIPIKYEDYNRMGLKYESYNEMKITFRDYANFAGLIFWQRLNTLWISKKFKKLNKKIKSLENSEWMDGYTAQMERPETAYRNALDLAIGLGGSPITLEEYAEGNYKFEDYNNLQIPIEEYAVRGINGVTVKERVGKLEEESENMNELIVSNKNAIAHARTEIMQKIDEIERRITELEGV